jgi:hypothetical protein
LELERYYLYYRALRHCAASYRQDQKTEIALKLTAQLYHEIPAYRYAAIKDFDFFIPKNQEKPGKRRLK